MVGLEAVNGVLILEKDTSYMKSEVSNMMEIPAPYTGRIDSVGKDIDNYLSGQRVAFCDMGGVYIEIDGRELVVVTPDMIIGILENGY